MSSTEQQAKLAEERIQEATPQVPKVILSAEQKEIFDRISKNEVSELKLALAQFKQNVDFVDENGMTPLQHAAYKGNKDAVQMLLDQGADVNSGKHEYNYTALHFGALSKSVDVCLKLLMAGANINAVNSVGRTAAQMAAFVGNHQVVATINNFVPLKEIEHFTRAQGSQKEPLLPVVHLEGFHKFVMQINIHPVRIALNLQKYGLFIDDLKRIKKVLDEMMEKEMKRRNEINEVMAFKYHYLGYFVNEIAKCRDYFLARKDRADGGSGKDLKSDFVELFAKRVLKQGKDGALEYVEATIRECVREFPFRECTVFRQVVSQLASKENVASALEIIKAAINGQHGFQDTISFCSSCGEEKPDKKCSKCKEVQYCDRECQRLHWFMHKKVCARPSSTATLGQLGKDAKKEIDSAEISEQLQKLVAS
ncbi:ankyrin repeat and MYND domain-containing protein 2 [Toxorhynchites rutilus septentrionalis]|uniref:ankyrin repeat and MYND domain-containing protein 2 n=1 Tax=Toxorhynchites rutilus septentrionalis TaxID=329112 RepID=UPI0024790AB5|nr:ankyrin repeat and MYND domain-containing protein 2 [Toxorhynchites rutilus septentrionalis]